MNIRAAALAVLLTAPIQAESGEMLRGPVAANVERVIDGDTLRVRVRVWLGQELTVAVRLRGLDAPELRAPCIAEREWARAARAVLAEAIAGRPVVLTEIEADKYHGRVVADVATPDGVPLGDALLAARLARAYAGGRRAPWC